MWLEDGEVALYNLAFRRRKGDTIPETVYIPIHVHTLWAALARLDGGGILPKVEKRRKRRLLSLLYTTLNQRRYRLICCRLSSEACSLRIILTSLAKVLRILYDLFAVMVKVT